MTATDSDKRKAIATTQCRHLEFFISDVTKLLVRYLLDAPRLDFGKTNLILIDTCREDSRVLSKISNPKAHN